MCTKEEDMCTKEEDMCTKEEKTSFNSPYQAY